MSPLSQVFHPTSASARSAKYCRSGAATTGLRSAGNTSDPLTSSFNDVGVSPGAAVYSNRTRANFFCGKKGTGIVNLAFAAVLLGDGDGDGDGGDGDGDGGDGDGDGGDGPSGRQPGGKVQLLFLVNTW